MECFLVNASLIFLLIPDFILNKAIWKSKGSFELNDSSVVKWLPWWYGAVVFQEKTI